MDYKEDCFHTWMTGEECAKYLSNKVKWIYAVREYSLQQKDGRVVTTKFDAPPLPDPTFKFDPESDLEAF